MALIALIQLGSTGLKRYHLQSSTKLFEQDVESQIRFDSLVLAANRSKPNALKPFNPNYISDFKGYTLGMSPLEIDRLRQFRTKNKFVNSKEEFQEVTGISDTLLDVIAPFFKFPDWIVQAKNTVETITHKQVFESVRDLNSASVNDLREIRGIGEKLSARIVKFRDRLGGFLVNEQLYDVYGLEAEVVERTLQKFQVLEPPKVKKININTASVEELAGLVYLRYQVAENIVMYREENGAFESLKDLFKVSEFPINKTDRIGLYLSY